MIETACGGCGNIFLVRNYKFKNHGKHCCSKNCVGTYRIKMGLGPPASSKFDKLYLIQREYETKNKTIKKIASKFKYSGSRILQLAKKYGWIKFQRSESVRVKYRKAAVIKMGRSLNRGEHVHHIDGLIVNNDIGNLHVFADARKHAECHGSLERVAFELYRQGLIKFNSEKGEYEMSKKHPGFAAVEKKIGQNPKIKNPGAVLAASSRNASKAAHKANPRLNRVKGK